MNNVKTAVLKLTHSCLLNCIGCIERKRLFKEEMKNLTRKMEFGNWKKIIDFLVHEYTYCSIIFSGGEPILYTKIEEMIDYTVKSKKSNRITLHTSLAFPRTMKIPENLFDVECVSVSFYGNTNTLFNQIRRPVNNFIQFSDVLFNFERLKRLPNFDIGKISFDLYPNIYNYRKLEEIKMFIKKYLGSSNVSINLFEWKHAHPEYWLSEKDWRFISKFVSPECCKLENDLLPGNKCHCKRGEFLLINILGEVLPCYNFEYIRSEECKPIGNIFDKDLYDIINSMEMEKFKNSETRDCCSFCFDWV